MTRTIFAAALAAALTLAGCGSPTQFRGDAKVKGGPDGCRAICAAWNMELSGMVAMGDYSTGCICQVPGAGAAAGGGAAATSAAPGVVIQMEHSRRTGAGMQPAPAPPAPR